MRELLEELQRGRRVGQKQKRWKEEERGEEGERKGCE